MYASSQYINIIGISQKLMCTIQFQAIIYYLLLIKQPVKHIIYLISKKFKPSQT